MTRWLAFAGVVPVVFSGVAVAGAAAQPSVAGRWTVNANISGTATQVTCTFTQKESELAGTCETEQGPLAATGKVEGNKVTWQFDAAWEGQRLTLVYSGALESPTRIAGAVVVQPLGAGGDFVATPAKTAS